MHLISQQWAQIKYKNRLNALHFIVDNTKMYFKTNYYLEGKSHVNAILIAA